MSDLIQLLTDNPLLVLIVVATLLQALGGLAAGAAKKASQSGKRASPPPAASPTRPAAAPPAQPRAQPRAAPVARPRPSNRGRAAEEVARELRRALGMDPEPPTPTGEHAPVEPPRPRPLAPSPPPLTGGSPLQTVEVRTATSSPQAGVPPALVPRHSTQSPLRPQSRPRPPRVPRPQGKLYDRTMGPVRAIVMGEIYGPPRSLRGWD